MYLHCAEMMDNPVNDVFGVSAFNHHLVSSRRQSLFSDIRVIIRGEDDQLDMTQNANFFDFPANVDFGKIRQTVVDNGCVRFFIDNQFQPLFARACTSGMKSSLLKESTIEPNDNRVVIDNHDFFGREVLRRLCGLWFV